MMSLLDNGGIIFTIGYVAGAAVPVFLLTLLFLGLTTRMVGSHSGLAVFLASLAAVFVAGVLSGLGNGLGGFADRFSNISLAAFVLQTPGAFVSIGIICVASHLRKAKQPSEAQT